MKKIIPTAVVLFFLSYTAKAQIKRDAANTPSKGAYIENGVLKPLEGYKLTLSADKKTVTATKIANGIGACNYNCYCPGGSGGCDLKIEGGVAKCEGTVVATCIDACKLEEANRNNSNLSQSIEVGDGKYIKLRDEDTTSKLPKGVKLVKGKITIQNGYKAVSSANNKIVFIVSAGGGVRGGFRCDCDPSPDGSCNASVINGKIVCGGDACCKIVVTIYGGDDLTMQKAEEKPEKLKWKKFVFPTKLN